jgi:phosphatidylglycerol:prolipoprotein diacylglycerol transferase
MNAFGWGAMEPGKNIRVSQLLAVVLVIAAAAFILYRRRKGLASVRYDDPIVPTKAAETEGDALEAGSSGTASGERRDAASVHEDPAT